MLSGDGIADVHVLLATQLTEYRIDKVEFLGSGYENIAYQVNGELIVRFRKETDEGNRAVLVDREVRLLTAVADISPVPVPTPRFVVPERGVLAYPMITGVPLLDLPGAARAAHAGAVAAVLGDLLGALHAAPVERFADLVEPDDQPLAGWLDDAAADYTAVTDALPAAYRPAIEAFLASPPPPPAAAPVFSHNDLGIEHVLVDPASGAVHGVIDWSDAAIVDPAYDFGLLLRDLGPAALDTALTAAGHRNPVALRARARFYARCGVFEDLAYGLDRPDRIAYVDKSLAALPWLFPSADH